MFSSEPKVLLDLSGRPMLDYVIDVARELKANHTVVVVQAADDPVAQHLLGKCELVFQGTPRGTGHALLCVPEQYLKGNEVVVISGDVPLIRSSSINKAIAFRRQGMHDAVIVSAILSNPKGYGRVIRRADGLFERIVEDSDIDLGMKDFREVNVGVYVFSDKFFGEHGAEIKLNTDNAQKEMYITDVFSYCKSVGIFTLEDSSEALGVNTRAQLSEANKFMQKRIVEKLLESGVTIVDPDKVYIEYDVRIGKDTIVEPFCFIGNGTVIGKGCRIGPFAEIRAATIGDNCVVAGSNIEDAKIGDNCVIGPFNRIRDGVILESFVRIGSYAEIKKSIIGENTRISHFSYIGDAVVGKDVNIGAGTVTCNYDGVSKHETIIEDNAFIGSGSMLVAPLRIGKGCTTGAGSVVTSDIPANAVAYGVPARVVRFKGEENGQN